MAIYEFAPGAQKTKDKAIHQVIGFTSDFINVHNGIKNTDTANQLPFSLNRWFVRCRVCGFLKRIRKNEKQNWKIKVNLMFAQIVVKTIRLNINRLLN